MFFLHGAKKGPIASSKETLRNPTPTKNNPYSKSALKVQKVFVTKRSFLMFAKMKQKYVLKLF